MRHTCEAEVLIGQPPDAVWTVVADVTRVGEWSGECRGCTWVGDANNPVAGARFIGRNRRGGLRWRRLNEIVVADAPRELVWRTIPHGIYRDSVEWRLTLQAHHGSTRVTESYRILHIPACMEWVISVFFAPHRDRTRDLRADLERLRAILEPPGSVPTPE